MIQDYTVYQINLSTREVTIVPAIASNIEAEAMICNSTNMHALIYGSVYYVMKNKEV